jgi:hypothetical protein
MAGSIEKAGGRVGIVGTGHRARVCPLLFVLLSLPSYSRSPSLSIILYTPKRLSPSCKLLSQLPPPHDLQL